MSRSSAKKSSKKSKNGATPTAPKSPAVSQSVAPSPVTPRVTPLVTSKTPAKATPKVATKVTGIPAPITEPVTPGDASTPSERFYMAALGILILAIGLRQLHLGDPPFHPDEAIHAFFSYTFANYKYDPVYHGPLLYHLEAAAFGLLGQFDYVARLVPSLLGIGLVGMLLGPMRRFIGNRAALISAALVAVSPSIVTYSRHLLHDSLCLVLTLGAVLCFLTVLLEPSNTEKGRNAIIGLAACMTLFLATKANVFFVAVVILAFWITWRFPFRIKAPIKALAPVPLALFAFVTVMAIALPRNNDSPVELQKVQHLLFQITALFSCTALWFWLWTRYQDPEEIEGRQRWKKGRDWTAYILAFAVALWLYVFLFGNGVQIIIQWGVNHTFPSELWIQGREGARLAVYNMLKYWGGQQGTPRLPGRHDYYVVLALLYEVPILICGIGGLWHAAKHRTLVTDFLIWWAVASWAVYAVANEKVPWLLVHMCLPLALLGGVWLASLRMSRTNWAVFGALGLLFSLRGDSAIVFERAGDNAEPILYAQTPEVFRDALLNAMRQTQGDGRDIWMDGERQWPTVWYVREDVRGSNPLRGSSGTPIGGQFNPDNYRIWVGQQTQYDYMVKNGMDKDWNVTNVDFLIWPRASWAALLPTRYIRWFITRDALPADERLVGQDKWKKSILAGRGEWSVANTYVGWRKK